MKAPASYCIVSLAAMLLMVSGAAAAGAEDSLRTDWGDKVELGEAIENPHTLSVVQDGLGIPWALVGDGSSRKYSTLARWTDGGWRTVRLPLSKEMLESNIRFQGESISGPVAVTWLESLAPGPDGTVLGGGGLSDDPCPQLRGHRFRWLPEPKYKAPWNLYRDAKERIWLTALEAKFIFLEGPKEYEPIMAAPAAGRDPLGYLLSALHQKQIHAAEFLPDPQGRYWYPFELLPGSRYRNKTDELIVLDPQMAQRKTPSQDMGKGLPPITICDGNKVHRFRHQWDSLDPGGQSYPRFLKPKDDGSLWLGATYGLHEIDTATLTGRSPDFPEKYERKPAEAIARLDNTWFAAIDGYLLKKSGDQWHEVLEFLDERPGASNPFRQFRPALNTPHGLWFGTAAGAVLIPKDSLEPLRYNWENGFSLSSVGVIEQLPGGKTLFAGFGSSDVVFEKNLPSAKKKNSDRFEFLFKPTQMAHDGAGHVWQLATVGARSEFERRHGLGPGRELRRWEGDHWRAFPVTMKNPFDHAEDLLCDSGGRVWLVANRGTKMTFLFTPPPIGGKEEGSWAKFLDYKQALAAEYQPGVHFITDSFGSFRMDSSGHPQHHATIARGPKGELALRDNKFVFCYDGSEWRQWAMKSITSSSRNYKSRVSFGEEGLLLLTPGASYACESGTWNWTPLETTESSRKPIAPIQDQELPLHPERQCPAGARHISTDRFGVQWMQNGPEVYRAAFGLCEPFLTEDEASPFARGIFPTAMVQSFAGDYFFNTGRYARDYLHVRRDNTAAPDTNAEITVNDAGNVEVRFTTAPAEGVRHSWRLDEGPWAKAVSESSARLDNLRPGEHSLEIVAIGAGLRFDKTPLVKSFSISTEPDRGKELIVEWIADLASEEERMRQAAIRKLTTRPTEAIRLLRERRKTADDTLRWLIDAAIQRCEEVLAGEREGAE